MKILNFLIIFLITYSNTVFAISKNDFIPDKAFKYKETIRKEIEVYFPDLYNFNYLPSLVEHESCISLTHKRCWEPTSQLKTSREIGAGLGQVTKAFNPDGTVRFDTLSEMAKRYKVELKEAKWETIYQRPDIQLRIIILMLRDDYKKLYAIENPEHRMQMVDAAYNGGLGGVLKERRACGLAQNCNPNVWFNNVEKTCLKSKKVLYGTRSACDINRHHVHDVFHNNIPKYNKSYFVIKEQQSETR